MMRALLAAISLFAFAVPAATQQVVSSPEADETYLTIYPDNLAMVSEVRRITVPEGRSTIRFLGVSDQIIAQTAVLQSFEGVSLESNFDSDLITKGALLNKAVGQTIQIRRIHPRSGKISLMDAKLVSSSNVNNAIQGAIFETPEGVEAFECSGLWEAIIFSGMPAELNPAPVLSMEVEAETAGEKEVTLSYLSQGIGWEADYRLDVENVSKGEGPLTGWLTVTNDTSKSFKEVPTAIIAGRLNRDYNTRSDYVPQKRYSPYCWQKGTTKTGIPAGYGFYDFDGRRQNYGGAVFATAMPAPQPVMMRAEAGFAMDEIMVTATKRQAVKEDFGDYKLYRTPNPITVAAMQTKQIAFLDVADAEYERVYKYDFYTHNLRPDNKAQNQPRRMLVEYEIDNSKEGNLAQPLPKGIMRVMTYRPDGQTAYLGESPVDDLAIDLPVEIPVSESAAVEILVEPKSITNDDELAVLLTAKLLNATAKTAVAEIEFKDDFIRYSHISEESHNRKPDTILPTYRFDVAPESFESFHVKLPVEQRAFYEHSTSSYDNNSYKRNIPSKELNLRGQAGDNWMLRQLFQNEPVNIVGLNARLVEQEKIQAENDVEVRAIEKFTFTNDQKRDVNIRFSYRNISVSKTVVVQEAQDLDGRLIPAITRQESTYLVKLLSSNIKPSDKDRLQWDLTVPAGGNLTLEVETQGNPRF